MTIREIIKERVYHYFWEEDLHCGRTSLLCMAELFDLKLEPQTVKAAIGMAGAGRFRAQCGLVEGSLMFLGIYFSQQGKTDEEIYRICFRFANEFTHKFSSLRCYELRPNGFSSVDPPHMCDMLAVEALTFTYQFVQDILELEERRKKTD